MINNIRPYSPQLNFGKSRTERRLEESYQKFEAAVADVADDNDKLTKKDVLTGGAAATGGFATVKAVKGIRLANRGADVAQLASKTVTKKASKFASHPLMKKLGPIGAVLATGLALGETANVAVNLIQHPSEN